MNENRRSERLRAILRRRGIRRRWEAFFALVVIAIAIVVPLEIVPRGVRWYKQQRDAEAAALREVPPEPAIVFPSTADASITIAKAHWQELGLRLAEVLPAPPPPPLKMDGVLYLDPDDYSLVRSRFQGEVVRMPEPAHPPAKDSMSAAAENPTGHLLRFGDEVKKGQVLAVIWSRELGEKKSELAEVLSQLAFDRETYEKVSVAAEAIPMNTIREAQRRVRSNEIAVQRVEKTLRSWQLTPAEIEDIRGEIVSDADLSQGSFLKPTTALPASANSDASQSESSVDRWASVEIRSPIDGTIVEKNITVGTLVEPTDALFKIANLDHLDVRAFAYEEDLSVLQRLAPDQREWTIKLRGDKTSAPIHGSFDRIGSLIDPLQHTGLVMGWVNNADGRLRAGQFVTANVTMPNADKLLSIPADSVIDVDGKTFVLAQQENPEHFQLTEVHVVRFQDSIACLHSLPIGAHVVTNGALEIVGEFQNHLKTNNSADPATP